MEAIGSAGAKSVKTKPRAESGVALLNLLESHSRVLTQSQRDGLTKAQGWCAAHLPWGRVIIMETTLKGLHHTTGANDATVSGL